MNYLPADELDRAVPLQAPPHTPADVLAEPESRRWSWFKVVMCAVAVADIVFIAEAVANAGPWFGQ